MHNNTEKWSWIFKSMEVRKKEKIIWRNEFFSILSNSKKISVLNNNNNVNHENKSIKKKNLK